MRRIASFGDPRIPPAGTPGFVTVHARAAYRASNVLTARLGIDNVANSLALEHGSGYYLPGFGATVSIEARFDGAD